MCYKVVLKMLPMMFIVFVTVLLVLAGYNDCQDEIMFRDDDASVGEGSACTFKRNGTVINGVCTPSDMCYEAIFQFEQHHITPSICMFNRSMSYVCCALYFAPPSYIDKTPTRAILSPSIDAFDFQGLQKIRRLYIDKL